MTDMQTLDPANETDPSETATAALPGRWVRRLPRDEFAFLWIAVAAAVIMGVFTIAWIYTSDHNVPTDSRPTTPTEFSEEVTAFMAANKVDKGVVTMDTGGEAWVMAERYRFFPELVLTEGETYTIWVSAKDVLHGFSIIGHNKHLNFTVAPGHAYGLKFTPDKAGEYKVICNEYCGNFHHVMASKITVKERS